MLLFVSLFACALLAALTVVTVAWLDERARVRRGVELIRALRAEIERHRDEDERLVAAFAPLTRKLRLIEGGSGQENEAS